VNFQFSSFPKNWGYFFGFFLLFSSISINASSIVGKLEHEILQEERNMLEKLLSGLTCLELKSESKSWNKMVKLIIQE